MASETSSVAEPIVTVPHPSSRPELQRRVLSLAAPVIGENLLQTLLGVVDTALVAGLGAAALAGVGTALQVIFLVVGILTALSVGASVLVAQAVGANDLEAASRFGRQALLWSVIISVPLAILGLVFSNDLIDLFGVAPDVAVIAVDYLHVTIGTIVTIMVLLIGGGVLRGAGDSRTPMVITALANVINVGLSYAWIYGHLGLPALGAVGSAWATFVARLIGAVLLIAVLVRGRNGVRLITPRSDRSIRHAFWPQWSVARDVLRIGLPAALEEVLVIGAFAVMTPIVAGLGTVALAAHRVVLTVLSLSFLPGIGFGLAATALVGQSVGAARRSDARAITNIALRWAMIWMGALGVVFLVFAPQLMRLFTTDPAMIATGATAIRVVAFTQPMWAGSFVYAGALRGTGNTRLPLVITGTAVWSTVGLGALALLLQPSLWALWAAFLVIGPLEVACFWWAWRGWQ